MPAVIANLEQRFTDYRSIMVGHLLNEYSRALHEYIIEHPISGEENHDKGIYQEASIVAMKTVLDYIATQSGAERLVGANIALAALQTVNGRNEVVEISGILLGIYSRNSIADWYNARKTPLGQINQFEVDENNNGLIVPALLVVDEGLAGDLKQLYVPLPKVISLLVQTPEQ